VTGTETKRFMRPKLVFFYVGSQILQTKNAVRNMITKHIQNITAAHYNIHLQ
jgi:hypothetical protein